MGRLFSTKQIPLWQKTLIFVFITFLTVTIVEIVRIKKLSARSLAEERTRLEKLSALPFEKSYLTPHQSKDVEIWQSSINSRSIAKFHESYFVATDGGLLQMTNDGEITRHFSVLDGLPESDLTCLLVFQNVLFIGTNSKGIIAFDGERFSLFRFLKHNTGTINSFLERDGKLLIATFNGGLIEFDGQEFIEIKTNEAKRLAAVNCLFKDGSKLFIGTFNNGFWLAEKGIWRQFTKLNGLLSNRVIGVEILGNNLYVATDFGISEAKIDEISLATQEHNLFHTIEILPSLSGLAKYQNQLYLVKNDGEIYQILTDKTRETSVINEVLQIEKSGSQNAHLLVSDNNLWILSNQGIAKARDSKSISFAKFGSDSSQIAPPNNFVSALTIDSLNRIWAGTFRNGIDIFSTDGKRITHLENQKLREINFLTKRENEVFAATSNGVVEVDNSLKMNNLNKADETLRRSFLHISFDENSEIYGTSKGLSIDKNGYLQTLTTVNGLLSNSVYAAQFYKKSLFVGTLGGLAEIVDGKIVRTFTDSNSNLTNNWVSAICTADSRLFIGTYGGGIMELTVSGELRDFSGEIGKFAVNQNAMFADHERLYVGTLKGVKILELQSNKWFSVTNILPSEAVFSITGSSDSIYFGTTNGIAKINKNYFKNLLNDER